MHSIQLLQEVQSGESVYMLKFVYLKPDADAFVAGLEASSAACDSQAWK